ncbi:hypothetical protein [Paenibacillus dakarensis]|uniref:hypothetical protein n=1 Tax=Paenibacillus dakarensis TaxID=1527293 RepID=UPI000A58ACC7|nr:hypothetical protein [Paenibacillus dakarensis]
MKIMISKIEAMERNIWAEIVLLFGLKDEEDATWDNEQFILTENQARELGLIK